MEIFLTGRTQCDHDGSCTSEEDLVVNGIRQGTILDPYFFLLYVDEMPNLVENKLKLFAIDFKFHEKSSTGHLRHSIERDEWQLKIISSKGKVLYLGRNKRRYEHHICGVGKPEATSCKDLGVVVTNDLFLKKHCSSILKTAYFLLK